MKNNHFRAMLLLSSVALLPATLPMAQAQAQIAEDAQAGVIDGTDIIVTAQRRSERLVDVPITITALSAERLSKAGITNTLELALVTPGLELPLNGAYTQPAIRGISSAGSGLADSSNVATYIDGVYQPSQTGQMADIPNVSDIQVLKGPQGTLYGQNAAGGAIIINTIQPSFTTKGVLTARYGNYDNKAVQGYVTGPLGETVAASVAAAWEDRDGFNKDLLRGGHDKGLRSHQVRGKLLWEPTSDMSFTLAGYYTRRNDSTAYAGQPFRNERSSGVPISELYGLAVPTGPHQFAHNIQPDIRIRTYGVSLLGKVPLGEAGTLQTVTAYGNVKVSDVQDVDVTGVNLTALSTFVVKQHDIIQEVNFISEKFGAFSFSAGLFYMYNTESYDPYNFAIYGGEAYPDTPDPTMLIGNYSRNKRNYYAAYLEGNYDLTDQLTLTLGGRYSSERQKVYASAIPDDSMYADPRGAFTFKKFTPRAVLRYKPDADSSLYASYSQGFKSGFVDANAIFACYDPNAGRAVQCTDGNGNPVPPTNPVKPEVVTAYEIGYKGKLVDGLTLSLSAFHYENKNIQVFIYRPSATSIGGYLNAAKARINGAEFDLSYRLTPDFTLGIGAVYMDAKYKKFENAQAYAPLGSTLDGQVVTCADAYPGGNCTISVDASGNRLIRAPKFTLTADAAWEHTADWGKLGASANLKYNSGFYFNANNSIKQGAYAILNGQIFVEPEALGGVRLSVYGKNLTNKDYLGSMLESAISSVVSYGSPRQYGMQADFRF